MLLLLLLLLLLLCRVFAAAAATPIVPRTYRRGWGLPLSPPRNSFSLLISLAAGFYYFFVLFFNMLPPWRHPPRRYEIEA